jgi:hypothetical protein
MSFGGDVVYENLTARQRQALVSPEIPGLEMPGPKPNVVKDIFYST